MGSLKQVSTVSEAQGDPKVASGTTMNSLVSLGQYEDPLKLNNIKEKAKDKDTKKVFKLDTLAYSFIALCLFVVPTFFSKDQGDYLFLWAALLLCFAPITIKFMRYGDKSSSMNFIARVSGRVIWLLNSPLCIILIFYASYVSLRTCVVEGFTYSTIQENIFLQLVPLLAYLVVINRLGVDFKNFSLWFVGILTVFAAISALLSLMFYATHIHTLNDILVTRMEIIPIGVATGTLTTHFGLIFSLFSIGALVILIESKSPPVKIFFVYLFVILFTAMLLAQSRGALLAFLVTLGIYFLASWRRLSTRGLVMAFFLTAALVGVTGFVMWPGGRLGDDNGPRFAVWRQALELAGNNLSAGYGERDFFVPILGYSDAMIYHGHNIFINALLRAGTVGLVCMLAFILIGLYQSLKVKRNFNDGLPLCLLLILTIAGLFDYDVVVRSKGWEWIAFWTVLGVVAAAESRLRHDNSAGEDLAKE